MNLEPTKNTKLILKRFAKLVTAIDNKFFYAVMGGIAVDGYAKKLTRNHPDVDILIFRSDLEKIERILKKLGYPYKKFSHPRETNYKYKIRTNDPDWTFTFQVIDKKPGNKFEIGFYRNPHMIYPISLIKPPKFLVLNNIRFPAISKTLLIKLKQNEIDFFEKLKERDPKKYHLKREQKHLNCLQDVKILNN